MRQNGMTQEIDMLGIVIIKMHAGPLSSFYQRAKCLDKLSFSPGVACLEPIPFFLSCSLPHLSTLSVCGFVLLLRAGNPVSDLHFSSVRYPNLVSPLFPMIHSCSVTSLGTFKLLGKLKLDIPELLLGLFSSGSLYLKEAISYSYLAGLYL